MRIWVKTLPVALLPSASSTTWRPNTKIAATSACEALNVIEHERDADEPVGQPDKFMTDTSRITRRE